MRRFGTSIMLPPINVDSSEMPTGTDTGGAELAPGQRYGPVAPPSTTPIILAALGGAAAVYFLWFR